MKLVIQHNLLNELSLLDIKAVVDKHSLPCVYVGVIPFSGEITSDEPLVGKEYLPYGSTALTVETHKLGWRGQYFDPITFNAEAWLENRDDMLNGDHVVSLNEAIELLRTYSPTTDMFLRPSEDLKQFSGQVMAAGEAANWLEDARNCASSGSYQLSPNTAIVISEPKNIRAEWRWFIVGGKIISGSMYRNRGQLMKARENYQSVISEAQRFADKWLPHPCCVMDLAVVDNEVKVIEFNTINSSGFYDHDVEKVFVELYKYACKE